MEFLEVPERLVVSRGLSFWVLAYVKTAAY